MNFGGATGRSSVNVQNQRSTSVNSNLSANHRYTRTNSSANNRFQNSEQKSMVRVALKNQKRTEKINIGLDSSENSQNRMYTSKMQTT